MPAPRCEICDEELDPLYECRRCGTFFCWECGSASDRVCLICRTLLQFEAEEEKGGWNNLEEEREEEDLEDEEESEDDEFEDDEWEEECMEGEPEDEEGADVLEDEEDLRRIEHGSTKLRSYDKPPFSTSET